MSWGLRAGWCPVRSSVASKQLHYVWEPLRIVLCVFCCRALWIQEDLSPQSWTRLIQKHTGIPICKSLDRRVDILLNPGADLMRVSTDKGNIWDGKALWCSEGWFFYPSLGRYTKNLTVSWSSPPPLCLDFHPQPPPTDHLASSPLQCELSVRRRDALMNIIAAH